MATKETADTLNNLNLFDDGENLRKQREKKSTKFEKKKASKFYSTGLVHFPDGHMGYALQSEP
jgi:hypothetical protein